MSTADIGLIGLAVMGSNLALNIAEKGYTIAVHNRTASRIDDFVATAKEQGLEVPARGSLPSDVVDAYHKAHAE